jgi:nucleotide-binding universal stress UspA family protein
MSDSMRILVGADASEHGDEAVHQGDAWARAHGWRLLVCHVAPPPLGVNMLFPQATEQQALAQPQLERRLGGLLRAHVGGLIHREPLQVETLIATGTPDVELVRTAEEHAVAMIVVGSHSHSGLRPIYLGDVAANILRHAHCSVLVARPQPGTQRILVGTDLSPGARAALALAADHASRTGARLTVACSIERQMDSVRGMTNFGAGHGFVESESEEVHRSAQQQLALELEAVGARGETLVLDGNPAAAIVKAAAASEADLLVIGATGQSGFKRALIGRITEKIVRAAPCSVLVVRAAGSR